jgi:hypothetical protein
MTNERELYRTPAPVRYSARGGAVGGLMVGFSHGIVTDRRLYFDDNKGRIDQFLLNRIQSLRVIPGKDAFLSIDLTDGCTIHISLERDTARRMAEKVTGGRVRGTRDLIPYQEHVAKYLSSQIKSAMTSFQPERVSSGCPLAGRCTCGCALCYIAGPTPSSYHCGTHKGSCHARCR